MVVDNICYILNNFIKCSLYENIIFCWVMHEQRIIDGILSRIDTSRLNVFLISLVASEAELNKRLQKDIENGLRDGDIIERSVTRLPLYNKLNTVKIDTDDLTVDLVAQKIMSLKKA